MLDLNSPRWNEFSVAGSNPPLVPKLIRSIMQSFNQQDWDEVWAQITHQGTLYPSAYAAVPYLVKLAIEQEVARDTAFFCGICLIAAPLEKVEPVPEDLAGEFEDALEKARTLAMQAAQSAIDSQPMDYVCALLAAAALEGRTGVARKLFWCVSPHGPDLELYCPQCEAYLIATMSDRGYYLQSVDNKNQPLSGKQFVTPAESPPSGVLQERGTRDFDWLAGMCQKAQQKKALQWMRYIYGTGKCPLCNAIFTILDEAMKMDEQ